MADMEKAINGLNEITHYDGEQMFYNDIFIRGIADDALELLKEQEAVEPTWRQGKAYCGSCGKRIPLKIGARYCHKCGRTVKWNC